MVRRTPLRPLRLALSVVTVVATLVVVSAGPAHAVVNDVKGSAFGVFANIGFFGGPALTDGPAPQVFLPPGGSGSPITASAATRLIVFGPATMFSCGKLDVSTQGVPGGSVTSTATVENVNKSGQEVFTAATASSTCTASGSTATGSTTLTGASLITSEVNIDIDEDDIKVQLPASPAPNTTHTGNIETVGDTYRYVFNEQIRGSDGSITVNAAHQRLLGPAGKGDLFIGQSMCGVTGSTGTTTTAPGATTTTVPGATTTTTVTSTTTSSVPDVGASSNRGPGNGNRNGNSGPGNGNSGPGNSGNSGNGGGNPGRR